MRMEGPLELGSPLQLLSPQRDKFPADGDHNLDSLPTLAMSAGALGALQVREGERDGAKAGAGQWRGRGGLGARAGVCQALPDAPMPCPQLPGVLTRLRADLFSYLRHLQWLRRAGGPSLRTLEPELGALQARLDRLLRRLQLLVRCPGSKT